MGVAATLPELSEWTIQLFHPSISNSFGGKLFNIKLDICGVFFSCI